MPEQNLIPQPEKSLALAEKSPIKRLLRSTRGKIGILFASVPLWKLAYNAIDAWGNLQMVTDYLPRVWQFLSSTAGTFLLMLVGFALIVLQLFRQSKQPAVMTKPDITGKIKRVYSQSWANAELSESKRMCFDYHFIINVYLANHGAATTIEQFKLILKKGERSYEGVRERDSHDLKEDEMDWRAWGAGELDDLEKSNDVPLEHTRNGSLWFVVFHVEDTKDKAEMELELYAIDKDGISHQLDTFPQSQWQDNPFLKKAWMDEARAKMRREF